jgi:eukaryotic-like serine/threonine-protein kinase
MNSSSPKNPWIGRSLGDNQRYRLDSRLGAGGMGDVFLATDIRLGQQVALKLLKDALVESPEMRTRFEHEIAICAALIDEHIVKIMDAGVTDEGFPFYVMEYLRGETLGDLLRREKQLTVDRTIKIISQVCNGLLLAHQGVALPSGEYIETVVHRDLKPDNIFLVPTDLGAWVKIVDFGIAKIRYKDDRPQTLTHTFLGTLRYASPEQMMGDRDLDGRSDVYSLGVILYEMLSGADPFGFNIQPRQMSEASWVIAHTSGQPVPLRTQAGCAHLSPELEAITLRCLEKTPDLRFGSVAELNLALQAVLNATDPSTDRIAADRTLVQPRPPQASAADDATLAKPIPAPVITPPEAPTIPITSSETIERPLTPPVALNPPEIDRTNVQPIPPDVLSSIEANLARQTNPAPLNPPELDRTNVQPLPPLPDRSTANNNPPEAETIAQPRFGTGEATPTSAANRIDRTQVQPRPFGSDTPPIVQPPVSPPQPQTPWLKIAIASFIGLGSIGGIYLFIKPKPAEVTQNSGINPDSSPPNNATATNSATLNLADTIKSLAAAKMEPDDEAKLQAAIDLASTIPSNSPDARAAKTLSTDAAKLSAAIKLANQKNLIEAIELAGKIPTTSPIHKKAQTYLKEWLSV